MKTIGFCAAVLVGGLISTSANAQQMPDLPKRKSGLWEISMNMGMPNMPPQVTKLCIDPETDAAMYKVGMNASQGMCSRNDIKRDGSVVNIDTACKMGDTQMTSHATVTFSGDTSYKTDIKTHFEPPMMGRADSEMTQEAKWMGACPADMKPGDMLAPNGMKMNMKEMSKQQ